MIPRFKILLLIPHLGGGGAERVMAHLARSLPCNRFEVNLGLVTRRDELPEKLPPCVHVHGINARRVLFGAVGLVRMIRQIRPDLILSTMFHLNFLVLLLRPLFPRTTRVLVRQNGMLSAGTSHSPSRLALLLYRSTYPLADGIICQTRAMAGEMARLLASTARIHVLRNPVDVQSIRRTVARPSRHWVGGGPHLLAAGRLSPEKGFDLLLDAFAAVRMLFPNADLAILGDGIQQKALKSRCATLGLGSSVRFAGNVAEPALWFAGASLLVIPSRHEALPNVLLEAAAAGLPIVATPCSAGMTELLHGQSGAWLTRDISSPALERSLKAALATLRTGERFRHPWLDSFELHDAVGQYEKLIL